MKNTKKVFKIFYLLDLEKQEKWLRAMANKGWFFRQVDSFGFYTFEKGPCKDVIYKIDFNRKIEDTKEYYDLFEQCGWKSIYKKGYFYYFQYTGDVSSLTNEVNNYNDNHINWIRRGLIIILAAYGINFVCLFTIYYSQRSPYNDLSSLKIIMGCLVILSIKLVWLINSYIILKKKIKEKEYKDYYESNHFKKASSMVSLLVFPVLATIIVFITFTSIYTIGGSDKAIMNKILKNDKYSLYPMKKIDYIVLKDFDNHRVGIYGNDHRIGMVTLDKAFLNRYNISNDFCGTLPSNQFVLKDRLAFNDGVYIPVYGKDDKEEIDKITLEFADGSKKEITKDSFVRKDGYFFIFQKTDETLSRIVIYDKQNVDITDKFIK